MFKRSLFNITVHILENNDILVFNTMSTAFAKMDQVTQKLYNNIEHLDFDRLEDSKSKKSIELMLQHGFIISKEIDELSVIKLRGLIAKFMNNKLILTIAPTLDCNMACPYCFEKRQKSRMNKDIQHNLVEFVIKSLDSRRCKHFHVTWYGGEPLLEVSAIVELSKQFMNLCKERDITYTATIITNGVLLTRDTAIKLKELNVSRAQITIDGLPEYHNNRRILLDGRDSFNIIMNNIEDCKDLIEIFVRINVDKTNMENINELTNYFLKEKGWNKNPCFYIAPVIEYEHNCGKTACINGEEYCNLDSYTTQLRYQFNPKSVRNELYPQRKSLGCAAQQYGNYIVDPDGDLYTCFNVIGNKKDKIGNICTPLNISNAHAKWLLHEPPKKCLSCQLLPICAGGCPYEYFLHGQPMCDKKIYSFKNRLKLAYYDYKESLKEDTISI